MWSGNEVKPTDAFLSLKVNELKEVCLVGGLSRQGRKADLQQRILNAMRHGGRVQQALERMLLKLPSNGSWIIMWPWRWKRRRSSWSPCWPLPGRKVSNELLK